MDSSDIQVKLKSLATAVPKNISDEEDLAERFGREAAKRITIATGIKSRRVATEEVKTLELCCEASRTAMKHAGILPENINGIIVTTQTPEYKLPATACILQDLLGLPQSSLAFDINLGCSGYPYSLFVAKSLLTQDGVDRLLVIVGDLTSITAAPDDQTTYPLFSDAYTATILEKSERQGDFKGISFGTDGSGWKNLVTHVGQSRHRDVKEFERHNGPELFPEVQYPDYTYMNGNEVFTFVIRVVPEMIMNALGQASLEMEEVDYFFIHQANLLFIKHLIRKLNIPKEKVPISIDRFGNTSGASPALTACDFFPKSNLTKPQTVAMVGFGVGFSWSTAILKLDPVLVCPIIEV